MNTPDSPDVTSLLHALSNKVVNQATTHPLSTIAGAAGVGVVLASGIPNIALRLGTAVAMRIAAAQLMNNLPNWSMPPKSED